MGHRLAGAPYWEIRFDKSGHLEEDDGLPAAIGASGVRDLFVFSHGWNSSAKGASSLHEALFTLLSDVLPADRRAGLGFVGVHWPSMLFPEDGPQDDGGPADASPTGGAQLAAVLEPAFPGQEQQVQQLGALLDQRPQEPAKLEQFARTAQSLVTTPRLGDPADNGEHGLVTATPQAALDAMPGSKAGGGGDIQGDNPFERSWHQARELLRTASYYEMKNRAGVVGKAGLGPLLTALQKESADLRVHLIGHSFGARLVSFSLSGLGAGPSPVKSLVLIQGAFSHFAFSPQKPGALADLASRVDGPLVSTFSALDRAVGTWYPNASLVARQDNQGDNDFLFRWGGVGHDGFQQDGVVQVDIAAAGSPYGFQSGTFYRVKSDGVIKKSLSAFSGAHCDIRHPEVAWVLASASGLGG
jgi:hypothetical protein